MTTPTTTEAGLPLDETSEQAATEEQLQRAAEALREHNFAVEIVERVADARALVNRLLPTDKTIFTSSSETLRLSGLDDDINTSGRFTPMRPKLMKLREEGRFDEMRIAGAAPDVVVGSVHAVTEDGRLLAASASGSQLSLYSFNAAPEYLGRRRPEGRPEPRDRPATHRDLLLPTGSRPIPCVDRPTRHARQDPHHQPRDVPRARHRRPRPRAHRLLMAGQQQETP
ncbi:LUD domain-containing protein [Micromonospora sp. NPDC005806]|uniref:LUD domain-containing protein n=1 Tax=Micromonospora sp. NPDC005806 TaxID=3364234 RepID=UPI00368F2235